MEKKISEKITTPVRLVCSAFFFFIWETGLSWCIGIDDSSWNNLLLFGQVSSSVDLIVAKVPTFSF